MGAFQKISSLIKVSMEMNSKYYFLARALALTSHRLRQRCNNMYVPPAYPCVRPSFPAPLFAAHAHPNNLATTLFLGNYFQIFSQVYFISCQDFILCFPSSVLVAFFLIGICLRMFLFSFSLGFYFILIFPKVPRGFGYKLPGCSLARQTLNFKSEYTF